MKRRYADGGDVFREGVGVPENTADMMSAPGPLNRAQRMGKMVIGSRKDLRPGDRRMLEPMLEPVPGEEVGVKKKREESKVYRKKDGEGSVEEVFEEAGRMGKDMPPMRLPKSPLVMYAEGGKVGSASKRADGCAQRGKTRGKFV